MYVKQIHGLKPIKEKIIDPVIRVRSIAIQVPNKLIINEGCPLETIFGNKNLKFYSNFTSH